MIDLSETRKKIDEVDSEIVRLVEERMLLASDVAEYKINIGKPVYDKQREEEKLENLGKKASNKFNEKAIKDLFLHIMSISRQYQYGIIGQNESKFIDKFSVVDELNINENTKVIYQGVEGAFSEQAMVQFFGENINKHNVESFKDIILELENGNADYGVLPIENSSAGAVTGVYDLIAQSNLYIVGEEIVKVKQALLGLPNAEISDIKTVYSHPQGLLQSAKYLEKTDWKQISLLNTAVSAKKVHEDNDVTQSAIASERAGKIYGLKVLESCINYNDQNATRFVILTKNKIHTKTANKISISFSLPHHCGTLYNVLSHFHYNNLSMTKIESRPLEGRQWEYRFFIDFSGNLEDINVKTALASIKEETQDFKIMGNY